MHLTSRIASALSLAAALLLSACGGGGGHGAAAHSHDDDEGPIITSIAPSSAEAGGPAFTLVVGGAKFAQGAVVRWNGADRPTTFTSDVQVQAEIAAADIAAPGSARITVVNPEGVTATGSSEPATFLVLTPGGSGTVTATTEFAIGTFTTHNDQRRPSVAALPTAGHNSAVACIQYEDDSADHQHYCAAAVDRVGNTVGTGLGVYITHHTENVNYIGLAAAPVTGEYVAPGRYHPIVSTPEPHPRSLYLQYFGDDSGVENAVNALPTETLGAALLDLDIAADPSLGTRFMVCKVTAVSGTDPGTPAEGINGVFFTGTSDTPSSAFLLSSSPFTHQRSCRIAFDGTSYLVVWESDGVIQGRRFDASCAPAGSDVTLSSGSGATAPRVAASPAGGFLVVWQQSGITARAVGADGTPAASTFSVSSTPGIAAPAIAGSPSGEWLVTWTGGDGAGSGIFMRRLDGALAPVGDEAPVNTVTAGDQLESSVTWAPAAEAWIVVWAGPDASGLGLRGRFVP